MFGPVPLPARPRFESLANMAAAASNEFLQRFPPSDPPKLPKRMAKLKNFANYL